MIPHEPAILEREAERLLAGMEVRDKPLTLKDRKAIPAQPMPSRPPEERRRHIGEVALGYGPAQARLEAVRCWQCRNAPCVRGCPVRIDIPGFVAALADGHFDDAAAIIRRNSILPAICGRVCPQESQCQAECTVGKALKDTDQAVAIGRLERFAADHERAAGGAALPEVAPETGRRVAVVGSGPASITVAADVRRAGHAVTLFEAFHKPGGVLLYGIPEFRLPKRIVEDEIATLKAMGVKVVTNFVVGRTRRLADLVEKDGFDAVFVGTGAGLPRFMDIEGENLVGVFSANEYLTRANLMRAYDRERAHTPIYRARKVAVLGGGNVAMDAARMALRLGATEVHLVYRRTEAEMPARVEEVHHAKEEGVRFHLLQNARRILGDEHGRVRAMECVRYDLGEPDASGRRRPVERPDSAFTMDVDTVIVAIGNASNPLIRQTTPGLETDRRGNLVVDGDGRTSLDRVFAGGDIVLGAATVILAMGEGRRAAASINRMLADEPRPAQNETQARGIPDGVEQSMTTIFKKCPMCATAWPTREALLADPEVEIRGYQVDFEELVAGIFLFNHRQCGTTFSLPVGAFEELRDGPVFTERLTGTSDCPGHCLRTADLEPCPLHCECNWVRDVIQRIRTWPTDHPAR